METPDRNAAVETRTAGFTHYRYLLFRHGWFLALVTPPAVAVAVVFALFAIPHKDPDLMARALIGIENREDLTADRNKAKENLGREDLMLGRTFIREVVRNLSLQVVIGEKRRTIFFDAAAVDSTTPSGLYRVRIDRSTGDLRVDYFDTNAFSAPLIGVLPFAKGRTILEGHRPKPGPIVVPGGLTLSFSKAWLADPRPFDFSVINIRMAVENVLRGLTIKRADPDKGINYITVQMTGFDYELSAATANEIARLFVEKNLSFSKQRSRSILAALEKQLALASSGQGSTSSELTSFQTGNSLVGTSVQASQSAAYLAQVEAGLRNTQQTLAQAEELSSSYTRAQGDEKVRIAAAMLETMSQNNAASARPLREALQQLVIEERNFAVNYDERHPLRTENARKIEQAVSEAATLFDAFSTTLRNKASSQKASINSLSRELRTLPSQEMQLGRLQRKQQVTSQVYSAVLERYNEAKVADAVEIADFYIMDAAVPPLPPPQDRSQAFIFALVIGLLLPVGGLVIHDRIAKTVYTKNALSAAFGMPVLEAIPKFSGHAPNGTKNGSPRIDIACHPAFIPELFDALFMKLRLRWGDNHGANVIAVTGLETGGGKSTIAVNLAIRLAQQGNTVLLVDTDMHRGKIHDQFNFPLSPGLVEALETPDESLLGGPFSLVYKTDVTNLSIITAGAETANSFNALSSNRFASYLALWRKHFRYVILDAAPIGVIPDAASFCASVDSYIFVVNAGATNTGALRDRLDEFAQVKAKVAGFVLNRSDTSEALLYHRSYSRYHRKKDA